MEKIKIKGFNGRYEATSNGDILSTRYKNSTECKKLKPAKDGKGYLRTALTFDKKSITIKVHRIIAMCFVPNPYDLPQVNHINGIKTDNRAINLEWCDNRFNQNHAVKNGLVKQKSGDKHHRTKHSDSFVLMIFNEHKNGASKRFLSKKYGVDRNIFKRKILING